MRVMGIDVGSAIVGWGVVEEDDSTNGLKCIDYGTITTAKEQPMGEKLNTIFLDLKVLLERYKPDSVGVEELYFFRNYTTITPVAQARGVILLQLHQKGIVWRGYSPTQVKQTIAGHGRAEKPQVGQMVTRLLNLPSLPKSDDAADALAIAITHLQIYKFELEKLNHAKI